LPRSPSVPEKKVIYLPTLNLRPDPSAQFRVSFEILRFLPRSVHLMWVLRVEFFLSPT
jgi:hypothetical protein